MGINKPTKLRGVLCLLAIVFLFQKGIFYMKDILRNIMETTKKCKICGANAVIQSDELGIMYRITCPEYHIFTDDKICPSATLEKPIPDEATLRELAEDWNALNE